MKPYSILFRTLILLLSLLISLILLGSCSKDDAPDGEPKIEQSLTATIDGYLDTNQTSSQAGVSILVRKDGDLVYQNNKGLARISDHHPINSDTGFRIGSISKPFTALGIMRLIEQGLLSLDDKLLDIVPELPDTYEEITLAQLLSHRAGLLDYIDDNTDPTNLDKVTTAQIIGVLPGSGLENLQFEPGTAGYYSNTGYVFLALVIERISGTSYPEFMQANFFGPLDMNNTFVISDAMHLGDLNNNYALNFGTDIKVKGFDSLIYGASGIVSSTNDLNLFIEALLSFQIVSQESLDTMRKVRGPLTGISDYGLGWMTGAGQFWHSGFLTDPNDFWHIGGFDGYRTILSINPDLNLEVVVLTNNGDKSQEHSYQILRLAREFYKSNPGSNQ